jgi:hypothetical protein
MLNLIICHILVSPVKIIWTRSKMAGRRMPEVPSVKNRIKVPDDQTAAFIILSKVILFRILNKIALISFLNK